MNWKFSAFWSLFSGFMAGYAFLADEIVFGIIHVFFVFVFAFFTYCSITKDDE